MRIFETVASVFTCGNVHRVKIRFLRKTYKNIQRLPSCCFCMYL